MKKTYNIVTIVILILNLTGVVAVYGACFDDCFCGEDIKSCCGGCMDEPEQPHDNCSGIDEVEAAVQEIIQCNCGEERGDCNCDTKVYLKSVPLNDFLKTNLSTFTNDLKIQNHLNFLTTEPVVQSFETSFITTYNNAISFLPIYIRISSLLI